jgi:phosphatidylserine/phosphatidylglycerophosphate/cardiolipin synthase-like enzyme
MTAIEERTLLDGGQTAEEIAARLLAWLGEARRSLDIALYDVRLPGAIGDAVADAIRALAGQGVAVRIAYNLDGNRAMKPLPPPPRTEPSLLEALGVPLRAIPGDPDLMHHKYVVRDGAAVWTGSTNWTLDSWTREENVLVTVASEAIARAYARDFDDLWRRGRVEGSGSFDVGAADVDGVPVRAWFSPGRGPELSHRIAHCISAARRRVRIASPVLTAAPVLAALNQALSEGVVDVAGVCDATQIAQVFGQWRSNEHSIWKAPLLARVLSGLPWTGKVSTPYAPGAVHDYMHAKVTVADDVVFLGSFNLSRSGEENAENVLEIVDPALAERMAAFVDAVRARYEPVAVPAYAAGNTSLGEAEIGRSADVGGPSPA